MPQTLRAPKVDQIDEETILKRYESLPDDLKEALMGVAAADAIYAIGHKANLNVEKIGDLAQEIGLIILGFVPSENFISDLKKILEANEEKASAIASEVNERVFIPIRESLKRIHGAAWADGITKAPLKAIGPIAAERRAAPQVAEIKPEAVARPVEKIPPATPSPAPPPPTPKEPLLIRPMGVPTAPSTQPPTPTLRAPAAQPAMRPTAPPPSPREAGYGRASPEAMPAERGQRQPTGRDQGGASIPKVAEKALPALVLPQEKKPFEIRPPSFAPQPPRPPEVNHPTFSPGVEPREKDLKPPLIPVARPQGIREGGGIKTTPPVLPFPQVKIPPQPPAAPPVKTSASPALKPLQPPVPRAPEAVIKVPPPSPREAGESGQRQPTGREGGPPLPKAKIQVPPPPLQQAGFDPYREQL